MSSPSNPPAKSHPPVSEDRAHLLTEQRLKESMELDSMSTEDAVAVMNAQDLRAVEAVIAERKHVARAIDELIVPALRTGGRLLYFGAGTSGRLGVLDASECPPTYRADPEMVQGVMAGGDCAVFRSREGAEDSADTGAKIVDEKNVGKNDVVMGIAAGGTTPFVHGALRRAAERGAKTIFLSCVQPVPNEPKVDVVIRPLTGPEVVTGSTRLKAGTATKLVLNQLTTLAFVRLNKVYGNLMVDLKASNAKLWDRGARIVSSVTGLDRDRALDLLRGADGHVKLAILMNKRKINVVEAKDLLEKSKGNLRAAIGE
jgi:N-acetylmuramic acid 6-phosphate etherase